MNTFEAQVVLCDVESFEIQPMIEAVRQLSSIANIYSAW